MAARRLVGHDAHVIPPAPSDESASAAAPVTPSAPKRPKRRRKDVSRADAHEDATRPDAREDAPRAVEPSAIALPGSVAALAALVLFAWGESILAFEWARQRFFEPANTSPLALTFPFFIAAAIAALGAARARAAGRSAVGGRMVHALGVASGILAFLALALALWLGPRLLRAQEDVRVLRAVRQMEDVSAGLAAHRAAAGRFPEAASVRQVIEILAPRLVGPPIPPEDPWGHPLEYVSLSEGRGYLLVSSGRDAALDLPIGDYAQARRGAFVGDDLVLMNGAFLSTGNSGLSDLVGGARSWQGQEGAFVEGATGAIPK